MLDVTVIIPTYNRADLVCTAVRSVLDQQGCRIEVMVVDDGSTDDTKAVLFGAFANLVHDLGSVADSYCASTDGMLALRRENVDYPCVWYGLQHNQGMSSALNTGLRFAGGDYVKFLDADDELMPDALAREVAVARGSQTDVVCTGFQERTYERGVELVERRQHAPPPEMARGIDDMLAGHAPWTAAALYRRSLIYTLSWPVHIRFANDWAWAWTVCLAGASFTSLNIESAIYKHHDSGQMTTANDGFEKSVVARQQILELVEGSLLAQGLLNTERRRALAQYYYKDSKTLCTQNRLAWKALWEHCCALQPGFLPEEYNPRVRPFIHVFGVYRGVIIYVEAKRWVLRKPTITRMVRLLLRTLRRDYVAGG